MMKNKARCSLRYCEKVLRKLNEITSSDNRRIAYSKLSEHFKESDINRLHQAIETLEHMECVSISKYSSNYGLEQDLIIKVKSGGVAYFVEKNQESRVRWKERIVSYILGVLTPLTVHLITEYLLPLIDKQ